MKKPAVTSMSAEGEVEIPEEVRKRLGLRAGTRFLVMAEGDVIILRKLPAPSMEDFDEIVAKLRKQAEEAGLKPEDISRVIREVRRDQRASEEEK